MSKADIKRAADTIRLLAADMIQKANSGHPGLPMGMADTAAVLWTKFYRHNPEDPTWMGRDRFILSPGHGSAMLYALLHLAGYPLTLEDLKGFRQWSTLTPGHPEYGHTSGVEVTTGPLGQGFANGVGMAMAARKLAADLKSADSGLLPELPRIWAIVSDGDMMEGITHEAASLAGHLKLDNMIYIYDKNNISIEGDTDMAFTESVEQRFQAYGWHTLGMDAHDFDDIEKTLAAALELKGAPVLIIARSHIGFGSPNKHDTAGVHGAPLGAEELALTKKNLGFDETRSFQVPAEVRTLFGERLTVLKENYNRWQDDYAKFRQKSPELAKHFDAEASLTIPTDLFLSFQQAVSGTKMASRKSSGNMLQIAAEKVPALWGGSADLAPSNNTLLKAYPYIDASDFSGRNIHFGIREHAMGAISNGIALFGLHIPFDATFLVFADYMRPSLRLAAMMKLRTIHVFTHDSIYVGEDGPTHQPVEQTAALRLIPGLTVIRPADEIETAAAWHTALTHKNGPTCLILSRQSIPTVDREKAFSLEEFEKGAYCVHGMNLKNPDIVLLSSGSELPVALEAIRKSGLEDRVRLLAVPSLELFRNAPEFYRKSLIPDSVPLTVSFEAGPAGSYYEFAPRGFRHIGLDRFGASAPAEELQKRFGLDADTVAKHLSKYIREI